MSRGLETSKLADTLVTLFHTDCNGGRKQDCRDLNQLETAPPQKHIC